MRLDGKHFWIVAGAIPLWYLGKKLKSWYTLKHLESYILSAPNGMEVHISPLGGIIQRLYVPDVHGELEDVVLGYDDLEAYLVSCCFMTRHGDKPPLQALHSELASFSATEWAMLLWGRCGALREQNCQGTVHAGGPHSQAGHQQPTKCPSW